MRIGFGYDVHRLVEGRPLVLGGIEIESDLGLLGHSDADVVLHAIADALLGAAALGDIGAHFPDTDAAWKDADSKVLLEAARGMISASGFRVHNVDVTVVLERPKLRSRIDDMREVIAGCLAVPMTSVSVKATTHEGVDAFGRREAAAAYAVCLLEEEASMSGGPESTGEAPKNG